MMRSLFIAASGLKAQQTNIDIISNNLSNVNTSGFRKSRPDFQSLIYQQLRQPAYGTEGFFNPTSKEVGHGVRIVGTMYEFTQGTPQETGNVTDICIMGEGFFAVQMPDGSVGYTRDSAMKIDQDGFIVNSNGYRLLSSTGNASASGTVSVSIGGKTLRHIRIEPEEIPSLNISEEGWISTDEIRVDDGVGISLVRFANPQALTSFGNNIFIHNEACGEIFVGQPGRGNFGSVHSGFLEASNVKIADEMVNMIICQRAYEINTKAVQTSDEIMGYTNQLKR
jgi:flagellar basal-body rod protein FlgG